MSKSSQLDVRPPQIRREAESRNEERMFRYTQIIVHLVLSVPASLFIGTLHHRGQRFPYIVYAVLVLSIVILNIFTHCSWLYRHPWVDPLKLPDRRYY